MTNALSTTSYTGIDAPIPGARLQVAHPRGRGFSIVSRLAREVPEHAPRHRRDDAEPELVRQTG